MLDDLIMCPASTPRCRGRKLSSPEGLAVRSARGMGHITGFNLLLKIGDRLFDERAE
jgi:hypothetical protein